MSPAQRDRLERRGLPVLFTLALAAGMLLAAAIEGGAVAL